MPGVNARARATPANYRRRLAIAINALRDAARIAEERGDSAATGNCYAALGYAVEAERQGLSPTQKAAPSPTREYVEGETTFFCKECGAGLGTRHRADCGDPARS